MPVRSNSAVSENLRIREFKECVSARPHLRKRGIHKCFPQRLLKFPLNDEVDPWNKLREEAINEEKVLERWNT